MPTPIELLQELLTSPKVVGWAEGVQQRMVHPLEAIAQASQEFMQQPVDELASSMISGGVGSIKGLTALRKSPISIQIEQEGEDAVLEKFKGIFNVEAIKRAISDTKDPRSRSTLVWLSPTEFTDLARQRTFPGTKEEYGKRYGSILTGIRSAEGLSDIPFLNMAEETSAAGNTYTRIVGHEGRHRADVFNKLGIDKIPVVIKHSVKRNSDSFLPASVLDEERLAYRNIPSPIKFSK